MEVPTIEQHQAHGDLLAQALARIARLEARLPEWISEAEAQRLTGLSQATLARERKKESTLLRFTTSGRLLYLASSVEEFNEARLARGSSRLAA